MTGPVDYVAFNAARQPGRTAAVDLASGRRWTYRVLDQAVARCARVLREDFECASGDRVASLAKNRVELVILHLACARTGLIYAPLNWRLSPAEIAAVLADAEPRLVVGDGEMERAGVSGVSLDVLAEAIDAAEPLAVEPGDPELPSLLLYTSGTSGRPKGVLLSERCLARTALNFGLLGDVTRRSVFLIDSPMFHIIGMVTSVRPALMHGGAILVSDGFQPARTLARLGDPDLGISHYFCVPQMAAMLRGEPGFDPRAMAGLTAIFTGGAPHRAADIQAWLDLGVPVVDGFGMSEAGTVFTMPLDRDQIAARAGAVGVAPPGIFSRIIDADGRDCPDGVAGELLLRGENLFSGYWRRPEETRAAFTSDGWFRTGDIALRDAEGFHWMVDRKKDMFISGGENVYPAEIEQALTGYPGLKEWAVVGVPDARWGEVGVCVLVTADDAEVSRDAVRTHLAERLARYKLPHRFEVIEALPRTASGKVRKNELRRWLTGSE
ncbi:MAG TPA: AMP-binding protein [Caulobacteraceae bacterium]